MNCGPSQNNRIKGPGAVLAVQWIGWLVIPSLEEQKKKNGKIVNTMAETQGNTLDR